MERINENPDARTVALLRLEGNLLRHEDRELENLVEELVQRRCRRLIIDFKQVEFVDSAGIGMIMKLAALIEKKGGALTLCNPQNNVRNVFSMLGIESRFKIFNDLGDALMMNGRQLRLEIISIKF